MIWEKRQRGSSPAQRNLPKVVVLDNANFSLDYSEAKPVIEDIDLVPLSEVQSVVESAALPTSYSYIPSSLPALQDWPGQYEFTASVETQDKTTKGVTWTYSREKHKLYVGKDTPCPINFSANRMLKDNVKIRVQALFTSPEYTAEVVARCMSHLHEDVQKGMAETEARHLVRCESVMALYKTDSVTKHNSVLVPYENPAAGEYFSTYIFKFTCYGSCNGGPSRRPLTLVFTLEESGKIVGRQKLDLKICACPGRDRKAEENSEKKDSEPERSSTKRKHLPDMFSEVSETIRMSKDLFPEKRLKTSSSGSQNGCYTIRAKNKDMFEFLIQMKKLYKIHKAYQQMPPEAKQELANMVNNKNFDSDSSQNAT